MKINHTAIRNKPLFAAIAVLAAPAAHAALISQVTATNAGPADWNDGTAWSDGNAPSGANDYVTNIRLDSPNNPPGTETFAGNSLRLDSGANLQLRNTGGPTEEITINLIMNGGEFASNSGGTLHLAGTIDVISNSSIKLFENATQQRNVVISSLISGGSGVELLNRRGSDIDSAFTRIDNASNTFSGTWVSDDARFFFDNAGAAGINASISVTNDGYTRVQGDWFGNALTAAAGGEVEVRDFSWTVNSLNANGFDFSEGTYTIAELNTLSTSTIFTGTTGTIQVVPEPSVALLGGIGLVGLLRRRR
jgi:hypothetical protein